MEEVLAQEQHVKLVTLILRQTELIYSNIITIICKMTRLSKAVSLSFAMQDDFMEEIIQAMRVRGSGASGEILNPQVVKQGLEVLLSICMACSDPQAFVDSHNLKPLFAQLQRVAKAKNLVIIEEIVGTLLEVCRI